MHKFLFLIILFSTLTIVGQEKSKGIYNKLSDKHIRIPGTKVSIIPPADFKLSNKIKGFQKAESAASITVVAVPGNIENNLLAFSKSALLKSNMFMLSEKNLIINNLRTKLITVKQIMYNRSYIKYMLITGNKYETYLLNGIILERNIKSEAKDIVKSLLSIVYESNKQINPLESYSFTINTKVSKFQPANIVSGSLILTVDGKVPTQSEDKSSVILSESYTAANNSDLTAFSIEKVKQYSSLKQIDKKNIQKINIDKLVGVELYGTGLNSRTGIVELVYQAMLFDKDKYYTFIGICNVDYEKNIESYRTLLNTFKRK